MSLEYTYTRKGKIGVTIITIWLIISIGLIIGGIASSLAITSSFPDVDFNQLYISYLILIVGIASTMVGSLIVFNLAAFDGNPDWYEFKEKTTGVDKDV